MRKRLKKSAIVLSAFLSVLIITLGIGVTIAYLGRSAAKDNTIIVGIGDASIDEEFSEPSIQRMVNDNMQKEVAVKNTGTVPCFVRVYAEFSDSEVAENASIYSYGVKLDWDDYKEALTDEDFSLDWQFIPLSGGSEPRELRGYFYYKRILQPGESTSKLIEAVATDFRTDPDDSNIDRIIPYEMIIYSETVQTVETGATEVTEVVGGQTVTRTVNGLEYTDAQWKQAWKSYLQTAY